MRVVLIIIGVMIVLAGALPFLSSIGVDTVPTDGPVYSFIIIAIGAGGLIYAIMNVTMMGFSKFVTASIALMTILGGLVPFITSFLPSTIPTVFPIYNLMIVLIGAIGIVYGLISVG